jgi:hypothetical protein
MGLFVTGRLGPSTSSISTLHLDLMLALAHVKEFMIEVDNEIMFILFGSKSCIYMSFNCVYAINTSVFQSKSITSSIISLISALHQSHLYPIPPRSPQLHTTITPYNLLLASISFSIASLLALIIDVKSTLTFPCSQT